MASNVLDVVAKALTVATNFLMLCSTGSADGVAFVVGVLGVDCAAGMGTMQTESVGGRGKLFSLCSSTASSVSNRGIASFFSHG